VHFGRKTFGLWGPSFWPSFGSLCGFFIFVEVGPFTARVAPPPQKKIKSLNNVGVVIVGNGLLRMRCCGYKK
jgi:hypothetical protein